MFLINYVSMFHTQKNPSITLSINAEPRLTDCTPGDTYVWEPGVNGCGLV